jgi:hypothetical protein
LFIYPVSLKSIYIQDSGKIVLTLVSTKLSAFLGGLYAVVVVDKKVVAGAVVVTIQVPVPAYKEIG